MVRSLLEARLLPGLPSYEWVQAEVRYGADGKSRVDFVLRSGGPDASGSTANAGVKRRRTRGAAATAAAEAAAVTSAIAATGVVASAAAEAAAVSAAATAAAAEETPASDLPAGQRPGCFLEVKSVTLAEDHGQARLCAAANLGTC